MWHLRTQCDVVVVVRQDIVQLLANLSAPCLQRTIILITFIVLVETAKIPGRDVPALRPPTAKGMKIMMMTITGPTLSKASKPRHLCHRQHEQYPHRPFDGDTRRLTAAEVTQTTTRHHRR